MAQINITLNQEEILQVFADNSGEAFRQLLQDNLNAILKAESKEQLKAEPYERTEDRQDCRNGTRERCLNTRVGSITLQVPRHRNVPFKTLIFENYKRSEAALVACMAEMVVNGVSTRKVETVMETLCGTSYSKSTVSEACKELDATVQAFRQRKLEASCPFVTLDATYFKVRENHRVISKALMIAYAINDYGQREVIGFEAYPRESKETWLDFVNGLKARGLRGVMLFTSDAHEGIRYAVGKVYPEVPWQRCQFHLTKNILDKAPKKYQAGLHAELLELWNLTNVTEARAKRDEIIEDYKDVAEAAMNCLDEGLEDAITTLAFPRFLHNYLRTSNHIERLNKELKRRSNVIGVFPNQESLLRLIGSVLVEHNEMCQSRRAIFTETTLEKLRKSEVVQRLVFIASEQLKELAA